MLLVAEGSRAEIHATATKSRVFHHLAAGPSFTGIYDVKEREAV